MAKAILSNPSKDGCQQRGLHPDEGTAAEMAPASGLKTSMYRFSLSTPM